MILTVLLNQTGAEVLLVQHPILHCGQQGLYFAALKHPDSCCVHGQAVSSTSGAKGDVWERGFAMGGILWMPARECGNTAKFLFSLRKSAGISTHWA